MTRGEVIPAGSRSAFFSSVASRGPIPLSDRTEAKSGVSTSGRMATLELRVERPKARPQYLARPDRSLNFLRAGPPALYHTPLTAQGGGALG